MLALFEIKMGNNFAVEKSLFKKFSVFRLAKSASYNSDHHYKIGCVITLHGKPVSVGFNLCKSHPRFTNKRNPSLHAEIRAILSCSCDLSGSVAFIYREDAFANPKLARPCNTCYQQLKTHGVKKIVYTISEYPYYAVEKVK